MEEQYDPLEKLTEDLVKDAGLEKPSVDFTFQVMQEIEEINAVEKQPIEIVYKPLISKMVWGMLISAFIGFVIVAKYMGLSFLDVSWLNAYKERMSVNKLEFSNIVVYGALSFGVYFLIQFTIIKRNLDKQYSL
ncbi:hypothetical protein [Aquimarina rhabdastrellae]